MKVGILAFGSLIDDPGPEIAAVAAGNPVTVQTHFPVEYSRLSRSRGGAPTLAPHASGGSVQARILPLVLGCTEKFAMDILWRREIRVENSTREYQLRRGANAVLVQPWRNFHGFEVVFYTDFNDEGKVSTPTPDNLARAAIESVSRADPGKDGISYLQTNIRNGIITPLTHEYEAEVLKLTGTSSLLEAFEISKNGRS